MWWSNLTMKNPLDAQEEYRIGVLGDVLTGNCWKTAKENSGWFGYIAVDLYEMGHKLTQFDLDNFRYALPRKRKATSDETNPTTHPELFRKLNKGEELKRGDLFELQKGFWKETVDVGEKEHQNNKINHYRLIENDRSPEAPLGYRKCEHGEVIKRNSQLWNFNINVFQEIRDDSFQIGKRQDINSVRDQKGVFYQFYNPITIIKNGGEYYQETEYKNPKLETKNMQIHKITVTHTPKVIPGTIPANPEFVINETQVLADNGNAALLQLGAQNSENLLKVLKTSTLQVYIEQQ